MSKKVTKGITYVCCGVMLAILTGCSSNSAPLTEKEQANFKGGPMPPEIRKKMEESQRKLQSAPPQVNGRK